MTTKEQLSSNLSNSMLDGVIKHNLDLDNPNRDYSAYLNDIHDELRHSIVANYLYYQGIFYNEDPDGDIVWVFIFSPMAGLPFEDVEDHAEEITKQFKSTFALDPDASMQAPEITHINGTWVILVPATT